MTTDAECVAALQTIITHAQVLTTVMLGEKPQDAVWANIPPQRLATWLLGNAQQVEKHLVSP